MLAKASQIAEESNAKLYVVHVDHGGQFTPPGATGYVEEFDEHKRLLEEGAVQNPNVDYELHYLKGNPTDEIRRFTVLRNIDLIVMGTHGRTGLARVLLGSIAERVTRTAPCEVILASPQGSTARVDS